MVKEHVALNYRFSRLQAISFDVTVGLNPLLDTLTRRTYCYPEFNGASVTVEPKDRPHSETKAADLHFMSFNASESCDKLYIPQKSLGN